MKKSDIDECFIPEDACDRWIGFRIPAQVHTQFEELKSKGNKRKIIERVKQALMAEIETLYGHAKSRGA